MKIIAYNITDEAMTIATDGEPVQRLTSQDNWLERLYCDAQPEVMQVMYHLDYNVAALLRQMNVTERQGKTLLENGQLYLRGTGYTLKYVPHKLFSIDYGGGSGHRYAIFSDMRQYQDSPVKQVPQHSARMDEERACRAAGTAQTVYDTLCELGYRPNNVISPISVFERAEMSHMDLPTVDDLPLEAGKLAYESCRGGWLEAFRLGKWDMLYDYDMVSAYPRQLAKLMDTRQGKWVKSSAWQEEAVYGWARIWLRMDAEFHPVLYQTDDNLSYTPTGERWTSLPKQELEFIKRHRLGEWEIDYGHWWIPKGRTTDRPLAKVIERLEREKDQRKGLGREVVKRTMNGIWGKLLETRDGEMGDHFNPAWASLVETNTRLTLAEAAMRHRIVPVHIAIDGMLTDRPLGLNGGNWKLTHKSAGLVVGSGVVALQGKHGRGDFSLDYDWMVQEITERPQARELVMHKASPWTLAKALSQKHWEKVGLVETMERRIYVDGESKRCYGERPRQIGDLMSHVYESVPWDVTVVQGKALAEC